MPGNTWGEIIYNFIIIYLVLSFALTCYSAVSYTHLRAHET